MTDDVIRNHSTYFDGQLHVVCPCGNAYVQVAAAGWRTSRSGTIVPEMTFRCDAGHTFPVSFVPHKGYVLVEAGDVGDDVPQEPQQREPVTIRSVHIDLNGNDPERLAKDMAERLHVLRGALASDPVSARQAAGPLKFSRDTQIHMAPAPAPPASGTNALSRWRSLVEAYYARLLKGYEVDGDVETGEKVTRLGPLASQAKAGNVYLVRGDCWRSSGFRRDRFDRWTGRKE